MAPGICDPSGFRVPHGRPAVRGGGHAGQIEIRTRTVCQMRIPLARLPNRSMDDCNDCAYGRDDIL